MADDGPVPVVERLRIAALRSFAAHGFEGASTHAIARQAGVTQGLVRHHFGSKAELWQQVAAAGLTQLAADLGDPGAELTIARWSSALERHADLVAMLVHEWLAGGERMQPLSPLLGELHARLRRLQLHALGPVAGEVLLWPWVAATLVGPLLARNAPAVEPVSARSRRLRLDALLAWLLTPAAPVAPGPFSLDAARARLRG